MPLIKQNVGGGTDWSKSTFVGTPSSSTNGNSILAGISGKGILTTVYNFNSTTRELYVQIDNSNSYMLINVPQYDVATVFVPFQNSIKLYGNNMVFSYNLL